MPFTSYAFILLFLSILLAGYFLFSKWRPKAGLCFLLAGCAIFYLSQGFGPALVLLGAMAIGVSRMLNIDLPENFDSPYQALSIRDFSYDAIITGTSMTRNFKTSEDSAATIWGISALAFARTRPQNTTPSISSCCARCTA